MWLPCPMNAQMSIWAEPIQIDHLELEGRVACEEGAHEAHDPCLHRIGSVAKWAWGVWALIPSRHRPVRGAGLGC